MDIAISEGGLSTQKARAIVRAYPAIWHGTVLDVGCRSRELEAALRLSGRTVRYVGVDIDPSAEVVADLGERLPFDDGSAEVVAACDVLEHTDDIHEALSELCRVAREHIVITLPNCYEVRVRLKHLCGQSVGGKYGLPTTPPPDRHRWFFSLDEARTFLRDAGRANGWRVSDERALIGPRRNHIGPAVRRWPNLFCQTYLALLRPL